MSRQAVSRWETNESLPDTEKVLQLCRIFGVSADDLLLDQAPETALKFNAARPLLPMQDEQPGSALTDTRYGAILPGGLLLLGIALALLAFDVLLSKRDQVQVPRSHRKESDI